MLNNSFDNCSDPTNYIDVRWGKGLSLMKLDKSPFNETAQFILDPTRSDRYNLGLSKQDKSSILYVYNFVENVEEKSVNK